MCLSARLARLERKAQPAPRPNSFWDPKPRWDPEHAGETLNILADVQHLDRVEGCFELLSAPERVALPMRPESARQIASAFQEFVDGGGAKDFRAFFAAYLPVPSGTQQMDEPKDLLRGPP